MLAVRTFWVPGLCRFCLA